MPTLVKQKVPPWEVTTLGFCNSPNVDVVLWKKPKGEQGAGACKYIVMVMGRRVKPEHHHTWPMLGLCRNQLTQAKNDLRKRCKRGGMEVTWVVGRPR